MDLRNSINRLKQFPIFRLGSSQTHKRILVSQLVKRNTAFCGTSYGGWTICPDDLSERSIIYSFGIGEDASFDLEVISRYGTSVYAFDPTPKSIDWVQMRSWPAQFRFHPIGIGGNDRVATFYPPSDSNHVSHSILRRNVSEESTVQVQLLRLETIAEMFGHQYIDVLKMDIEGAEYEVIDDIVRSPRILVRQVLVEFHHSFGGFSINDTYTAINQLEMAGYKLFNVSDRGVEFSFIRT